MELDKKVEYFFKGGPLYSHEHKRHYISCKFLEYHTLNDHRFIKVLALRQRPDGDGKYIKDEIWLTPDMLASPDAIACPIPNESRGNGNNG